MNVEVFFPVRADSVGSPPALTQVMSGQIPIMFDGIVTSLPLIRGGKLKPYAIGGVKSRSPPFPMCRPSRNWAT